MKSFEVILVRLNDSVEIEDRLSILKSLVSQLRPKKKSELKYSLDRFKELNTLLAARPELALLLKDAVHNMVLESDLTRLLAENGILKNRVFRHELAERISLKFLPEVYRPRSILYKLDQIFDFDRDYFWIDAIPDEYWSTLFDFLDFESLNDRQYITQQIIKSITVLSYRIAGLGLEKEIVDRIGVNDEVVLPYIEQNIVLNHIIEKFNEHAIAELGNSEDFRHLQVMLSQCLENIETIRKSRKTLGTSLEQSFILARIRQHVVRMQVLLEIIFDKEEGEDFVHFMKQTFLYLNQKNKIRPLLRDNASMLAYQISEHAGNTGEHYITETPKEYRAFLFSSAGGGVIAGTMAFVKVLLHHLSIAPFWEAMAYSCNYALGFNLIQLTGSTLATKQPAMTASALAASIDINKNNYVSYKELAITIARVFRSQFVSFVGNLSICFPIGIAFVFLYQWVMKVPLLSEEQALTMLKDIHPWHSGALFFASVAGVYLFLGGIVSGYYDNKLIYSHISARIQRSNMKRWVGHKNTIRFAHYLEHNMGSVVGNVFLGICLGSTAIFAHFFGLGLDIRHVTISTSNFGMAVYVLWGKMSLKLILVSVLGLTGIGFLNFLVSFGLAFTVAILSRNIFMDKYKVILGRVKQYFVKYPKDFFFPPKEARQESDIWPEDQNKERNV